MSGDVAPLERWRVDIKITRDNNSKRPFFVRGIMISLGRAFLMTNTASIHYVFRIGDQKQVDLGNGLSDTKMPA